MKKIFKYIFILLAIFYWGCDKPAPTELIDSQNSSDAFDVEIVGKDISNEFYSNGYDTSGVTEDLREFGNIISVSGIKITRNGKTENISVAETILSDKSKPVYSAQGTLIGYNTVTPGTVRFNSELARLANVQVKFRENGELMDTVLGKKYELYNFSGRFLGDNFRYNYNSSVSFLFNPIVGQQTTFDIPTPKEVTASVRLVKTQNQNGFRAELKWNGENYDNFYIIIGGVFSSNQQVFPFYRIKTADDGSIVIPASLFENIPRDSFNKISFTFVRKYIGFNQTQNNSVYVTSQSIHTIILGLP